MSTSSEPRSDLSTLVGLFYRDQQALGEFTEVSGLEMPSVYRRLLDHIHHMTVTVESFHNTPVDVQVLQHQLTDQHYAREILLTRQSDGQVVQYGIVRINFSFVQPEVRQEIEQMQTPLGRILINHNVLRRIHLNNLWKVEPSPHLAEVMNIDPHTVYGRTALIECNDEPAIELLEIVTV